MVALLKSSLQYFSDWWHIERVASNISRIGGTSEKLPPIFFGLEAHRKSSLQYFSDWWRIERVASNIF
ncbi:hypothetical protein TEH_11160 [Tetragenococcus halophilus NBRC 12172]|uniref:Uncharacterized protein n=1 Tax=Tetragenococcus halophilus (strain DSM 20338 / JCM 20259 / NCIMB 9735 / NBRC 12172) TaxID=945021 RepID=A0AAN1VQX3_TETHN|nr:hypothetical protein TEH_11160 [Tetragenococcus halophilus NBRC 12172]